MKTAAELRQRAELKLELRAAKAAAARAERAASDIEEQRRRAAQAELRRQTRERRHARQAEMWRSVAAFAARWRTVAPIGLVTGFAVGGQFAYGLEEYKQGSLAVTVLIAVGAGAAAESISLYVQWHAHDALLHGATATAARLRRASYLLALAVAAVNYSHFSDGWKPTPAAVVFALFSASSPWLWGLHTRRAQRMQLLREGKVDSTGAVFSAERFRAFPIRTIGARRLSIDLGISDPRIAWEVHRLQVQFRRAAFANRRVARDRGLFAWVTRRFYSTPITPAEMPELERDEDVVAPDLELVDDKGLSLLWKTAPAASSAAPRAAKTARPAAAPRNVDMDRARELRANGAGWVQLGREFGLNEYQAKQLVKSLSTNGHKVRAS
jgi:hypothetical protein